MNVLIMADYSAPKSGNFIASLVELSEHMKKSDNIYFVFPEKLGGYTWAGWIESSCGHRIIYMDNKEPGSLLFSKINNIIDVYKINIIHSHFGYLHSILIKNKIKLRRVKILFHDRMGFSADVNLKKQMIKLSLYSLFYRINGIGIISVMKNKDLAYKLDWKLHWHVPNGLSLRRNIEFSETREQCRKRLCIPHDEKLCIVLGWAMKIKGLDIAVKAVDIYRNKYSAMTLGIIGLGASPSEQQLDFIKKNTGIDPNSKWIRYFKSTEDIYSYHRAADVYLSASRTEAFSNGILEAISQNTPVVVSNIEGTSWSHMYSKCFSYPTEDAEACSDALEKAMEIGRADSNYLEIVDNYNVDKWCARIMKIYSSLL